MYSNATMRVDERVIGTVHRMSAEMRRDTGAFDAYVQGDSRRPWDSSRSSAGDQVTCEPDSFARAATSRHHPMRLLIERYQRNWEELPSLLAFIWRARSCAAPYATLDGYEALRKAVGVFELRTSLASSLGAHRCVSWLAVSGRRSCTRCLS